ncbi:MAG: crossover junction endodeoxyribonuclease RuvC [Puniceicoccales bacterium]|nr:crossover junction endodeoxyribonuclease RuvC [Puniceicoccales bacterium]
MARKSARRLWTDALASGSLALYKAKNTPMAHLRGCEGIIIGIDPSLRGTGIAILESRGNRINFIFSKRLSLAPRFSFYGCLGKIFKEVDEIIAKYCPDYAAMEETIFVQNYKIAQTLGSVRGTIIAALMGRGIEICEYPPLRIKQAVTGIGRASKEQVMGTIKNLLNIDREISTDESDAIAVACCHAWTFTSQ